MQLIFGFRRFCSYLEKEYYYPGRGMIDLVFSLLLIFNAHTAADVNLTSENSRILFGDKIEIYEDRENLDLEELLRKNPQWVKAGQKNYNFGFTGSSYWLRFTFENTTGQDAWITLNTIRDNVVNIYIPDHKGRYVEKQGGNIHPVSRRDLRDFNIYFRVPFSPGTKTIYMKTSSEYLCAFTPEVLLPERLVYKNNILLPAYWLYYGLLVTIILYNLFILFTVRERTYFILVLLVFFYLLLDTSQDGFFTLFLFPENPLLGDKVFVLSCCIVGALAGFFFQS